MSNICRQYNIPIQNIIMHVFLSTASEVVMYEEIVIHLYLRYYRKVSINISKAHDLHQQ